MDRRTFLMGVTGAALASRLGRAEEPPMPSGRMTLAAVGDCLLTRRLSGGASGPGVRDPGFLELVEILRGADCTWGNCELVVADHRGLFAMPKGVDPHSIAPPWVADELAWAGIDLVGVANNHILDFGYEGLARTLENLDRVGIPYAGAGDDLAQATKPSYYDSVAGRVGQVNCCSTFPRYFAASAAHPHLRGRPGLNPLNLQWSVQVERDLFQRLKKLEPVFMDLSGMDEFEGLEDIALGKQEEDSGFFGETPYKSGDRVDILSPADPKDVTRITDALKVARSSAHLVLATIHAHECRDRLELADTFLQPFARACIDAGADAFLLAGPHVLRGIEMYKGRPIFYSLGNFFFQHEVIQPLPAELFTAYGLPADTLDSTKVGQSIVVYTSQRRFWESFVPVVAYEAGKVTSIDLYPIVLGHGRPLFERGLPTLARGEDAKRILERLAELSRPYGTEIEIQGDVAKVRI